MPRVSIEDDRAYSKKYKQANKDKIRVASRVYYTAHTAECLARNKKWARQNPDRVKQARRRYLIAHEGVIAAYARRKKYGLSPEDFSAMVGEQMCLCKACRQPMTMVARQSNSCHVDHDHKTGKIRGLLCARCNKAIGFVQDCPQRLRQLIEYLEHG